MRIENSFYLYRTDKIAQKLLGCFLIRKYRNKIYRAMITETEAYRGFYDLASHASRGKTRRNQVMFGKSGRAYVYLVYGMHWMLNIVTEKENFPAAILIRGAIAENDGETIDLNGPGKLTKFFYINKSFNGANLITGEKLWLEHNEVNRKKYRIIKSHRVGVDYAKHCKKWKWNFKLEKNKRRIFIPNAQ